MILTVDIGNSSIGIGAMTERGCVFTASLSTSAERTADEYAALLTLIAAGRGLALNEASGAIICSVVPQLTPVIRDALAAASGKKPLIVGPGVKTGLNIHIDDPSELGGDCVASAVAALSSYPLPCVTVEMSAATVLGVLDKNGVYVGCVISPGVMVSQNALVSGASQLYHVSPEAPQRVIGRNTEASVKSGVVFGAAAMLDGLLDRIEEELGERVCTVAYGEWADKVVPHCRRRGIVLDDGLLMRGLKLIYDKNAK